MTMCATWVSDDARIRRLLYHSGGPARCFHTSMDVSPRGRSYKIITVSHNMGILPSTLIPMTDLVKNVASGVSHITKQMGLSSPSSRNGATLLYRTMASLTFDS